MGVPIMRAGARWKLNLMERKAEKLSCATEMTIVTQA